MQQNIKQQQKSIFFITQAKIGTELFYNKTVNKIYR